MTNNSSEVEKLLRKVEAEIAMETLLHYCNKTACEDCIFHYTDGVCGIQNPAVWKGRNNEY